MAYIKKEQMDQFIDIMFENGLTPLMLVGPFLERKYSDKNRNPRLLTSAQIMQVLGISKSTLYRYMDDGMPFQYRGEGRGRLFDKELCLAFVKQQKAIKKKGAKTLNEKF